MVAWEFARKKLMGMECFTEAQAWAAYRLAEPKTVRQCLDLLLADGIVVVDADDPPPPPPKPKPRAKARAKPRAKPRAKQPKAAGSDAKAAGSDAKAAGSDVAATPPAAAAAAPPAPAPAKRKAAAAAAAAVGGQPTPKPKRRKQAELAIVPAPLPLPPARHHAADRVAHHPFEQWEDFNNAVRRAKGDETGAKVLALRASVLRGVGPAYQRALDKHPWQLGTLGALRQRLQPAGALDDAMRLMPTPKGRKNAQPTAAERSQLWNVYFTARVALCKVATWSGQLEYDTVRQIEEALFHCCRHHPRPRPAEHPKPRRKAAAEKYEWELANGGTPFAALNGRELAALIAAAAGKPAPQRKGDRFAVEVTEKRRKQLVELVKAAHVRSEREEKAAKKAEKAERKQQEKLMLENARQPAPRPAPPQVCGCGDRLCGGAGAGCPYWRAKRQEEEELVAGVEEEWDNIGEEEGAADDAAAEPAGPAEPEESDEFDDSFLENFDPDAAVAAAGAAAGVPAVP